MSDSTHDPKRLYARVVARVGSVHIDIEIEVSARTLVIVGPNGAGKSSLLKLLLGALPVDHGKITVGNTVILDTEARVDIPVEHRRFGYLPQNYALFPHMSVRDNIGFALESASPATDRRHIEASIDSLLREFGLEAFARRRPSTLSGGEQQRVALARALSTRPRALLLDEPLTALDVHARREVRLALASHLDALDIPALVVTHDPADARALGQQIAALEEGKITQVGSWDDLSRHPATRFVEEMLSSADDLNPLAMTR